ncbi:MAG TPA: nucleoside hydrolase [Methylomirabilota bacterium]|jgi:purine nucleosidase/pyrimidine-specific ribonucleoside hydrolase
MAEGRTPTVIDTDPGIDDALALLLAWGSPELDVLALTVVAGNAPLDATARNAARLVAVRRPTRVPQIALGATGPLKRALVISAQNEHGSDGLGDAVDWPPVTGPPASPSAAETLVALARAHGERSTLIALGPLTNLALALRLDAEALRRIGRIVVMGGAVDVPGNTAMDSEFNIYVDPDAAREVLDAGLRVDLVPLDATRQTRLERDPLHAALAGRPGPLAARIEAFTEQSFRIWGYMHLHDPLAVGLAVDTSLAQWEPVRIAVGEDGQTRRAAGAPNCRVAQVIDAERFLAMFFDRLCPQSSAQG